MKYSPVVIKNLSSMLAVAAFISVTGLAHGEDAETETTKEVQDASPDGRYAFLHTEKPDDRTLDLIDAKSEKVLKRVAESDPDAPGQFEVESILWREDSKAFAITVWLERRASAVVVFVKGDQGFHKLELPKLTAETPKNLIQGRGIDHVVSNNAQSASSWTVTGSLVVEIENIMDGGDSSASARRTVELKLDHSGKARVVKSSIKYGTE